MIQELVDKFMSRKDQLASIFAEKHPDDYGDVVHAVVDVLNDPGYFEYMDPGRIHQIDDSEYQGTLVFVIPDGKVYPSNYWYVRIGYGSCCACDTLAGIRSSTYDRPSPEQVADYMTLALHVVQGIRKMDGDIV